MNERENIQILSFNATTGIQHKNTHVRILNRTDRTDDRIIFQILIYLILLTDTGSIYQIKVKTKLFITGIDRIAGSTCNLCYNITVLPDKGIDNRRFPGIRTSYYCKTRDILIQQFFTLLTEFTYHQIQQFPCTASA